MPELTTSKEAHEMLARELGVYISLQTFRLWLKKWVAEGSGIVVQPHPRARYYVNPAKLKERLDAQR
jgi:hypothetical protein